MNAHSSPSEYWALTTLWSRYCLCRNICTMLLQNKDIRKAQIWEDSAGQWSKTLFEILLSWKNVFFFFFLHRKYNQWNQETHLGDCCRLGYRTWVVPKQPPKKKKKKLLHAFMIWNWIGSKVAVLWVLFFSQVFFVCLLILVPHLSPTTSNSSGTKRSQDTQCSLPVTQRSWRKVYYCWRRCVSQRDKEEG